MTQREVTPILTAEQQNAQAQDDAELARRLEAGPLGPPPGLEGRITGGGIRTHPQPSVSSESRQRIQAAIAFHFGGTLPGIEWTSAVDPITDRFIDLADGNPDLIGSLERDVNTMFALTDMDIAERIMRGEPVSQFGDVFDSIAEVSWEIGATDLAARIEAERADNIKGAFDALSVKDAQILALGNDEIREAAMDDPEGFVDLSTSDLAKAQSFQTLFDVPGAWSYSPSSGMLAVTIGAQTVGVEARPGFDPESHLDAMAEVVSAHNDGRLVGDELTGGQAEGGIGKMIDKAHEVGAWIETRPWARDGVDAIWQGLTLGEADEGLEGERQELEARKEKVSEESLRLASAVPFPEDATIAALARKIMGTVPGIESQDALAQAASAVDENRDQFVAEFESLTQEQLVRELEEEVEGQSPLGLAVEGTMENALGYFEAWDVFTQTIGVNVIDVIEDLFAAGSLAVETEWQEGFDRLKKVFEPPEGESEDTVLGLPQITAAEYFDLDGAAADGANLLVGLLFDPVNYVLPGAKGLRMIARRALTNPKYAGIYLRTGQIDSLVKQVAGTTRGGWVSRLRRHVSGFGRSKTDDLAKMSPFEAAAKFGEDADEYAAVVDRVNAIDDLVENEGLSLVDAGREVERRIAAEAVEPDEAGVARAVRNVAAMSGLDSPEIVDLIRLAHDPASTPDQVREVLTRAMGKNWLGEGPQRAQRHSTVEGIGQSLESIAEGKLSDEAVQTVMQMTAKLTVGRTFRVGEAEVLDNFADLLTQIYPHDKDKFTSWFLEAANRWSAGNDPLAAKGAAALQKEEARRAAWNSGGAVRSINLGVGGDLRGVQQNLTQIEEALANLPRTGGPDTAFLETGETLYRGSTRTESGVRGGRAYFTDDPEVASRFAESGIPVRSLSETLDIDIVDDLAASDVEFLFSGGSSVQVATGEVDDAGELLFRNVASADELVEVAQSAGPEYLDEIVVRQLRPDRQPQVTQATVFGRTLDLTPGNIEQTLEANPGLREALDADRLLTSRSRRDSQGFANASLGDETVLEGWRQHERSFDNTRDWMRENGFGKARVPDDPNVSGEVSVIGIEDFIGNADEVAGRVGATVDDVNSGLREELERMHSVMSRRAAEASPKIAAQQAKRREAHRQLKQATWLENDVANTARNRMGSLVYELYDEIAEDLNTRFLSQFGEDVVPIIPGRINPLAPDVPVRDWSRITGKANDVLTDEDELALMMGLAVDDADVARGLTAVGAFSRSQKVVMPASPYEVLAFRTLAKNETALATWTQLIRSNWMRSVSRTIKGVFAVNLLLNPLTAGKITLDETLRFLADTGEVGKFVRATAAGLPGVGRGSEALVNHVTTRYGSRVANPHAAQYRRNVGGWSADDFSDYGWVERPSLRGKSPNRFALDDYRQQAERWVNGTLMQDTRFREYARFIDEATVLDDGTKIPPQGFIDWWEDGAGVTRPGKMDTRHTTVTIRDTVTMGDELTAQQAFNIMDSAFEHWLAAVVDEGARDAVRSAFLNTARTAGKLDVTKDARIFNAIQRVPGLQGRDGFGSRVFNVFFGAPSGRRAGVFYEHYYDEAMEILTERHAGRVLTVDDIAEYAPDRQTAEYWLKQGDSNDVVSRLLADTGAVTEGQLAARAAVYAERRADDLMYRFTSASLAGRGVESGLMFPFARAQVDFLSWWVDHMTKPLNLFQKLPPGARARLPGVVQNAMNAVDRIPINLRAWANFSHMVSTVNNEHPSVVDQTVDSLTFFPFRFDSEFLLDVSPQFGPLPSWLFDIMVDKGIIGEDVEKNFEALFPALSFTEIESDPVEDVFNRLLPSSRRSLRDFSAGMARAAYAIFGQDIHTNPGAIGQIVNMVADNKLPAATGDFQAALAAEFIGENVWDIVPGSDEWNRAVNGLAVQGAVEANRQEFSQDLKDRVSPFTEYDAEYRALRAYEGMFDDQVFGDLVSANIFQANDLLEQDNGKSRIQDTWDRYVEGEATKQELAWLDDRLTTAYFEAGRLEIRPGFSYLDFLNLSSPQISVNLINKSEDSGIHTRTAEHYEFKQKYIDRLTGRLQNVPPGDTGREIIIEARRRGWLVNRPVEEWAFDAAAAVYKSGQRAVRGVWENVSHRTWQAGLKKAIEDKTFTLPAADAEILKRAGLELEAGTQYTYREFHELLDAFDERFDVAQPVLIDTLERGAVHSQLSRHDDEFGQGLLFGINEIETRMRDDGIDSVSDWPEEWKERVRGAFNEAITLGYTTIEDYEQEIEPIFGPIDYQPPVPPAVPELKAGVSLTGDELEDIQVIDGDTVSILLDDGPMRVRLIGINSPEVTQEGYSEARSNLARVVEDADEVVLGVYEPETFGLTQLTAPGERRLLMWLYIDGVPIYDPSVFTADNPRGAGVGGNVLDLDAILEAGRE